jgi:hypothetical protein
MAVTVDDLKEPVGELDLDLLFPDISTSTAEDNLTVWMGQAIAMMTEAGITDPDIIDRGTSAYAYYRAYRSIYQRLAASPSSQNLADAGISQSMSAQQIQSFQTKEVSWMRVWESIVEAATPASVVPFTTQAIETQVSW